MVEYTRDIQNGTRSGTFGDSPFEWPDAANVLAIVVSELGLKEFLQERFDFNPEFTASTYDVQPHRLVVWTPQKMQVSSVRNDVRTNKGMALTPELNASTMQDIEWFVRDGLQEKGSVIATAVGKLGKQALYTFALFCQCWNAKVPEEFAALTESDIPVFDRLMKLMPNQTPNMQRSAMFADESADKEGPHITALKDSNGHTWKHRIVNRLKSHPDNKKGSFKNFATHHPMNVWHNLKTNRVAESGISMGNHYKSGIALSPDSTYHIRHYKPYKAEKE
jgi:hypothetical protein